jgi:hypothetical protein
VNPEQTEQTELMVQTEQTEPMELPANGVLKVNPAHPAQTELMVPPVLQQLLALMARL